MTARRRGPDLLESKFGRMIFAPLPAMLALTFSTGVADAIGYLALDKVFTGNMTGNVVILGMAMGGADGLPVAGPAIALVTFVVGAALGGRVLKRTAPGWATPVSALLVMVAAIMAALTVYCIFLGNTLTHLTMMVIAGALAGAMGVQAAAARHVAVRDVTTVVVTSTLTGLAYDSKLGRATSELWVRRLLAVILILVGALTGALLLRVGLAAGLGLSAAITLVATGAGHLGYLRDRAESTRNQVHAATQSAAP